MWYLSFLIIVFLTVFPNFYPKGNANLPLASGGMMVCEWYSSCISCDPCIPAMRALGRTSMLFREKALRNFGYNISFIV